MAIGVDGMIAQEFWLRNISSQMVAETNGVKPGVPVKNDANGNIILCTADADKPVGVVVASYYMCSCDCSTDALVYKKGDCAPVMEEGRIYVTASEAVAIGDPAYFVRASGKYSKTSGAGSIPLKAKFATAAAADGIVTLELYWDRNV